MRAVDGGRLQCLVVPLILRDMVVAACLMDYLSALQIGSHLLAIYLLLYAFT